ncbi:MAG: histidine kinase dimerization/phospho-acceptor domain-containing protein [Pseudomonadota bacterium]
MRFDDTLETVLAADLGSPQAAQSAWRQVVDLIGRRRVPADARAMSVLRAIRGNVPVTVRASTARALEFADPPAPLVRLFAVDELSVALPVLRNARMNSAEWIQLLPDLAPAGRAVLRNRRDLGPVVKRALEAFGPIDFVLPDETVKAAEALPEPVVEAPAVIEPITEALPAEIEPEVAAAAEIEAPQPEPVLALPEPEPEPEPVAEMEIPQLEPVMEAPMVFEPAEIVPEQLSVEVALEPVSEPEPALSPPPVTFWTSTYHAAPAAPVAAVSAISDALIESPWVEATETVVAPVAAEPSIEEVEDFSFVALAGTAASLPFSTAFSAAQSEVVPPPVQSGTVEPIAPAEAIAPDASGLHGPIMEQGDLSVVEPSGDALDMLTEGVPAVAAGDGGTFEIAEVVARIDAFWREREETGPRVSVPSDNFRFETDSKGVFRWVEGVSRAALVGLSLDAQSGAGVPEASRIDGVAAGAFRRRAGFSNARLAIEGESDAAGDWQISGIPVFDPANGRFTGYRGTARRPRADERAEPVRAAPPPIPADSLRQLVHELRTPTNAIAGFAEMIESQMLGPVSGPYRGRAAEIRAQARELLGAIDDLDLAARIDSAALALVPGRVALRPVLSGIADDLAPLAELRGSVLALPIDDLAVTGDRRAVERLLARLLATLVSASGPGERIGVNMAVAADDMIAIAIDRPQALADYPGDSVLGIDDEREDATLLGTGFALRLARNLARELGGALVIEAKSLTLRLPASDNASVGQVHLN